MDGKGFSLLLGLAETRAIAVSGSTVGPHEHVASVEVRLG